MQLYTTGIRGEVYYNLSYRIDRDRKNMIRVGCFKVRECLALCAFDLFPHEESYNTNTPFGKGHTTPSLSLSLSLSLSGLSCPCVRTKRGR